MAVDVEEEKMIDTRPISYGTEPPPSIFRRFWPLTRIQRRRLWPNFKWPLPKSQKPKAKTPQPQTRLLPPESKHQWIA